MSGSKAQHLLVCRSDISIPPCNIDFVGVLRVSHSLLHWSMVVTGGHRNGLHSDWRRAKRLGTRVSRIGSYTRVERRCLGRNEGTSIINHQSVQRCDACEASRRISSDGLRGDWKKTSDLRNKGRSRIFATASYTYDISDQTSMSAVRTLMNHRECLLTTECTRIDEPSVVKSGCHHSQGHMSQSRDL